MGVVVWFGDWFGSGFLYVKRCMYGRNDGEGKGMAFGPARPGLDLEGICFGAWILGRKGVLGWCGMSCGCRLVVQGQADMAS